MLHLIAVIASILCPLACGGLGFFVTTRPPEKFKGWFEAAFGALALAGAAAAFWLNLESEAAQAKLEGSISEVNQQLVGVRQQIGKLVEMQISAAAPPRTVQPAAVAAPQTPTHAAPAKPLSALAPADQTAAAHIKFVQRPFVSTRTEFPYATQVIIQTDQAISSPRFLVNGDRDSDIEDGDFFLTGQAVMMSVSSGVRDDHKAYRLGFGFPVFTPDAPIVVTLYGKSAIKVSSVQDIRGQP